MFCACSGLRFPTHLHPPSNGESGYETPGPGSWPWISPTTRPMIPSSVTGAIATASCPGSCLRGWWEQPTRPASFLQFFGLCTATFQTPSVGPTCALGLQSDRPWCLPLELLPPGQGHLTIALQLQDHPSNGLSWSVLSLTPADSPC